VHVRLAVAFDEIAKRQEAFYPFALGKLAQRRRTEGSMAKSLFKHISEFLSADQDELLTPFHSPIPLLGSFFQCSHLLRCGAVFSLSIVGGLDVHLTQGDNVSTANDANIFAACCCGEPTT
jgi:hypothetical protein